MVASHSRLFSVIERFHTKAEIAQMCGDPNTPTDTLVALVVGQPWGGLPYPGTDHELLAKNPSVPMELLLRLMSRCPKQVTQNPAFRMSMVINPRFLDELSLSHQEYLAGCEAGIDKAIIRHLADHRSKPLKVRIRAARNPKTPKDMLRAYTRHAWQVRAHLVLNPKLPKDIQPILARDKKHVVRAYLAERHDLLDETIEILLAGDLASIDSELILNPKISDEVRWRIFELLGYGSTHWSNSRKGRRQKRDERWNRRPPTGFFG